MFHGDGVRKMEDNRNYWQGKFEQEEKRVRRLEERVKRWYTAFGWVTAVLVFLVLIITISALSSDTQIIEKGYTPEQVTDISVKMYKDLCISGVSNSQASDLKGDEQ